MNQALNLENITITTKATINNSNLPPSQRESKFKDQIAQLT